MSVSQCIPLVGPRFNRQLVICLDKSKMLRRFRIIKLLISWGILENFLEEVACALYLKKISRFGALEMW